MWSENKLAVYMPIVGNHPMESASHVTASVYDMVVGSWRDEYKGKLCAAYGWTEAVAEAYCRKWEREVDMIETRVAVMELALLVRGGGVLYLENN